jgi:hypothetical protein
MNNKKSRAKTVRKSKAKAKAKTISKAISKTKSKSRKARNARATRSASATRNARATRSARATRNSKAKRTGGFNIIERIISIINKYLKKDENNDYSQADIKSLATKLANGTKGFTETEREIEEILNRYLEELDDVSGDEVTDQNILVLFNNHIDNKKKAYDCLFENNCE